MTARLQRSCTASSGSIHPITWMAIGAGLIGVVVVLAVLLGFFDRGTAPTVSTAPASDSKTLAHTQHPLKPDAREESGNWWDKLVDDTPHSSKASPATEKDPIVPPHSPVMPKGGKSRNGAPVVGEPAAAAAAPDATPKQLSAEDLYEQIVPSVVTIKVMDDYGEHIATGSGFFVGKETVEKRYATAGFYRALSSRETQRGTPTEYGYVLTNYHVIRPAVSADVILFNGDKGSVAEVVAEDEKVDLALLTVTIKTSHAINAIPLAREDPRVLATVYAIGSPKGLSGSASEGKVSGFRELSEGERWLQTTAPISHGSSGGPLLLADGTLAGVTTLILDDAQNLNFAVPESKVRAFLLSEYRSREIAEGASLRWEEDHAFVQMSVALDSSTSSYSSASKNAGQTLEKAWQELGDRFLDKGTQEIEHCERAIALAQQADPAAQRVQVPPGVHRRGGEFLAGVRKQVTR